MEIIDGKKLYKLAMQIQSDMIKYEFYDKREHRLGRMEGNLLRYLSTHRKALIMREVAAAMGISHSRVTHLCDALLAKGYIIRFSSETDRRIFLTEITQEGIEVIANYEDRMVDRYNKILNRLPEAKQRFILENLNKWKSFLDIELKERQK